MTDKSSGTNIHPPNGHINDLYIINEFQGNSQSVEVKDENLGKIPGQQNTVSKDSFPEGGLQGWMNLLGWYVGATIQS
jgi:hypothetical protein